MNGAFYISGVSDTRDQHYQTTRDEYGILFSAQKSNAIYGASQTVQPPSIVLIPQIRF